MAKEVKVSRIIVDLLARIIEVLKVHKIPYAVMGGLALQAWGRERATRDIDIVVSLDEVGDQEFLKALEERRLEVARSNKRLGQFGLIETRYTPPELGLPIEADFFVARTEYQRQLLKRGVSISVLGHRFKLVSPEDLIIIKLLSGRPLDRSDAQNIVGEQKSFLDRRYLFFWARKFGIERRLQNLLSEI